jgi:DNA primase
VSGPRDGLVAGALLDAIPSANGWWRTNCPFCSSTLGKPDRKRSFGVFVQTGGYHCFRCGMSGRAQNLALPESLADAPPVPIEAMDPPPGFLALASHEGETALCLEPARRYLRGRGIDERLWRDAGIGACATGRYADRVVVPIMADDGTWAGWVARTWNKQAERTYLYPRGMQRGDLLYRHSILRERTTAPAMVVEGVFDVLALWPNAVALLGKPSGSQVEALVASNRPVVIVLDGDAWEEGRMLALKLRFRGQHAGSVRLPPRIDPDEVPLAWLHEEARRALLA